MQKLAERVVREIIVLGLKADRERGDPSLGMGLNLVDAKALRQAARRRIDVTPSSETLSVAASEECADKKGERDDVYHDDKMTEPSKQRKISPEAALFARVKAEVVKEDKVRLMPAFYVLASS